MSLQFNTFTPVFVLPSAGEDNDVQVQIVQKPAAVWTQPLTLTFVVHKNGGQLPEDLHGREDGGQDVRDAVKAGKRAEGHGQSPRETKHHILNNGAVVIGLQGET